MLPFVPLLADLVDVLKALIPLVILIFWVLSQVFGQKAAKPGPGGGAPGGAGGNDPAQGGLRQEIERFLREAREEAERQQGQQKGQQQPQAPAVDAEQRRQQKQEKQRRKQERQREQARQRAKEISSGQRPLAAPEIVEDVTVVGPAESVAEHVSAYMDSSKFGQSAAQLGQQAGQADERLTSHLHHAFDHKVGMLGVQPSEVDRGGAAAVVSVLGGAQLAAQLSDPQTFRNAIILNEVLARPEHRWD